MKNSILKTTMLFAALGTATLLNAQNTSLGHTRGGLAKDTVITYTEDPEKHAHTQTTVINPDDKKSGDKKSEATSNQSGNGAPAPDTTSSTTTTASDNSSSTVTDNTVVSTGTSDDTCSCTSLHIAYGVAAAGILGLLIFLALYLNEKNKDKNNSNRS